MASPKSIPWRWTGAAASWAWAFAALAPPALAQPAWQADPELAALSEKEVPGALETLRRLTSIDSGTGQGSGMAAIADLVEQFVKPLGGEIDRVTPANGVAGPNVVVTFKGKGQRRIMLMSHMDTVYPAGTAAARPFRIDGNRAIAPGIADDKGGIAVFLHAVKLLKARGFDDYERITMVFNSDEERGSSGSRDLIRTRAQQHDAILSGEPTTQNEGIVMATSGVGQLSARLRFGGPFGTTEARPIEELADLVLRSKDVQQQVPGTRMNWTVARAEDPRGLERLPAAEYSLRTLTFRIQGRASHAGVAPDQGVNALIETARLVQRVSAAAAAVDGARLHWRTASAGLVSNIIADRGQAVAELAVPKALDATAVVSALLERGRQASLADAQVSAEASEGLAARTGGSGEALATADVRVPDAATMPVLSQQARQAIGNPKFPGSTITVQDGLGFPAYNASEEGRRLAERARTIYAALGGKLELIARTYGGTDAVWAAQSGKPVVESMGLPGGNYHSSEEEFVLIDRIGRRLALVAEMIRALAKP